MRVRALVLLLALLGSATASAFELAAEQRADLARRDPTTRLAIVDLVRYLPGRDRTGYRAAVTRLGGTIAWDGTVDQLFIGHSTETWDELIVSEYPSAGALAEALRHEQTSDATDGLAAHRTELAEPWPWYGRLAARVVFSVLNLLGGGPPPLSEAALGDAARLVGPNGGGGLGPTTEQMVAYAAHSTPTRVGMFNFLKFPPAPPPGSDVPYDDYGRAVAKLIGRVGGRLAWIGWASGTRWDEITLAEYPSRSAFLGMVASPEYAAIVGHRTAGLVDTQLFACTPWPEF